MGICICGSPRPGEHCDECDVTHPVPVVTYAEAEARLTDEVLDRASRAYAGRYQWRESQMTAERRTPMRDVLLSALFPDGGQ